jgi:GNAT superfamily N-acetyltransferase
MERKTLDVRPGKRKEQWDIINYLQTEAASFICAGEHPKSFWTCMPRIFTSHLYVAYDGGIFVGYIAYAPTEIFLIEVMESHRKMGVGSQLIQYAEKHITELCKSSDLEFVVLLDTYGFWIKNGYTVDQCYAHKRLGLRMDDVKISTNKDIPINTSENKAMVTPKLPPVNGFSANKKKRIRKKHKKT